MTAPADAGFVFAGGNAHIVQSTSGNLVSNGSGVGVGPTLDLSATGWNAQVGDQLVFYQFQAHATAPTNPTDTNSGTWSNQGSISRVGASSIISSRPLVTADLISSFTITMGTLTATTGAGYVALLLRNWSGDSDIVTKASGSSLAPASGALTPTTDQSLVLAFAGIAATDTFSATPSGYASWETTSGNGVAINFGYVRQGTAAATTPAWTATPTSAQWVTEVLALRVGVEPVSTGANGAAGTQVSSALGALSAGQQIVIALNHLAGTVPATLTLTDGTTTWNPALLVSEVSSGSTVCLGIYAFTMPASSSGTVTLSTTTLTASWVAFTEVMALTDAATLLDPLTGNVATGTAATAISIGPTSVPAKAKDDLWLIVGTVASESGMTPATGFSLFKRSASANGSIIITRKPTFTAAAQTVTGTLPTASDWVGVVLAIRLAPASAPVSDDASTTDTAGTTLAARRSLSDGSALTDAVVATPSTGMQTRSVGDSATASDAATRTVATTRSQADSATATDTVSRTGKLFRPLADGAALLDGVTKGLKRTLTEYYAAGQGTVAAVGAKQAGSHPITNFPADYAANVIRYGRFMESNYGVMTWQNGAGVYNEGSALADYVTFFTDMIETGQAAMLSWEPSSGVATNVTQPTFNWSAIISGTHDAYIARFANWCKALDFPLIIRLYQELNGAGYVWAENVNGNTTLTNCALSWKHIVDIFTAQGVTNVKWCFCWAANQPLTDLQTLYPGDAYVDYVGWDMYNKVAPSRSFDTIASPSYALATSTLNAGSPTTRPIILPEVGSTEYASSGLDVTFANGLTPDGVTKATWYSDAFGSATNNGGIVRTNYPQIQLVQFYDLADATHDFSIDTTTQSQAAWQAAFQQPYWQGRFNKKDVAIHAVGIIRNQADSATATDTVARVLATSTSLSGALGASGALPRRIQKLVAGAVGSGGVLGRALTRTTGSVLTVTGALARAASRLLPASTSPTGTTLRSLGRRLAGSISTSGTAPRNVARPLAAAIAPGGLSRRAAARSLAGSLTSAGAFTRNAARTLGSSIAASGAWSSLVNGGIHAYTLSLSASIALTGAISRFLSRSEIGQIAPAGSVSRFASRLTSAALAPTSGLVRASRRLLAGTATAAGAMLRTAQRQLVGGETAGGTTVRTGGRSLLSGLGPTGSTVRRTARALLASLAPAGLLPRSIARKMVASITASGAWSSVLNGGVHAYTLTLTASLAAAGAMTKFLSRVLGGSMSPAGLVGRALARRSSAAESTGGGLVRSLARNLPGSQTSLGSFTRSAARSLAGSVAVAGSLLRAIQHRLTASQAPGGGETRSLGRALGGLLAPGGSTVRSATRSLLGSSTPVGGAVRSASRSLLGSLTGSGAWSSLLNGGTHAYTLALNASLAVSGAATRLLSRALGGSLTSNGALRRALARISTGTVTPATSLVRAMTRSIGGAEAPTGTAPRSLLRSLAAAVTPTGISVRGAARSLSAATAAGAAFARGIGAALTGSLSPSSFSTRTLKRTLSAVTAPLGLAQRRVSRMLSGAVGLTGSVASVKAKTLALFSSLTRSGSIQRGLQRSQGASIAPAGALSRGLARSLGSVGGLSGKLSTLIGTLLFPTAIDLQISLQTHTDLAATQQTVAAVTTHLETHIDLTIQERTPV